ncbi:hypothetical protein HK105_202046 [Polyrhizophydium stewartii]|uniref:Uncharacterized protein n=1 Tax=Polyrhizophydium stewartii TaxID=2732419 RepID=A0ABR4NGQ5_9FUNG
MLKKSLRTLHLHHNTLAQLPEGLFELLGLAELDVSHNQLTCLSPHIGRLVHLLDLRISHNRLTQLPQSIHLCSSLASIDMSHNALEWLPAEIKQLTKLRSLAADGNRFNILAIRIEKVASPMRLADIALQAVGSALAQHGTLHALCAAPGGYGPGVALGVAPGGPHPTPASRIHPPQTTDPHQKCVDAPFLQSDRLIAAAVQVNTVLAEPDHACAPCHELVDGSVRQRLACADPCCAIAHIPLLRCSTVSLLADPDHAALIDKCGHCRMPAFQSGAALFEVLVKCGQPVPVRFLFCSLLCKTRHKRGLRERSVGGNIAGRTQQGNAAHGAAAHHPLVRARLRTWDGSSVNINLTH